MDKLEVAIDKLEVEFNNLVASNAKLDKTLNELTRSVQWISIIRLTYYIVTVLVVAAYFM